MYEPPSRRVLPKGLPLALPPLRNGILGLVSSKKRGAMLSGQEYIQHHGSCASNLVAVLFSSVAQYYSESMNPRTGVSTPPAGRDSIGYDLDISGI